MMGLSPTDARTAVIMLLVLGLGFILGILWMQTERRWSAWWHARHQQYENDDSFFDRDITMYPLKKQQPQAVVVRRARGQRAVRG